MTWHIVKKKRTSLYFIYRKKFIILNWYNFRLAPDRVLVFNLPLTVPPVTVQVALTSLQVPSAQVPEADRALRQRKTVNVYWHNGRPSGGPSRFRELDRRKKI